MGDGVSVRSTVAAAVVAGIGGAVVETFSLVTGVDRIRTAVAVCTVTASRWGTAGATAGTSRD